MANIFTQRKRNSVSHMKQIGDDMFWFIEYFGKCDRNFQRQFAKISMCVSKKATLPLDHLAAVIRRCF